MKNIMPQKSNLATPRMNRLKVYPFFSSNNKTYIFKDDKIFTGIPETPALNNILDSVTTKVKPAPFTISTLFLYYCTVFQIKILKKLS